MRFYGCRLGSQYKSHHLRCGVFISPAMMDHAMSKRTQHQRGDRHPCKLSAMAKSWLPRILRTPCPHFPNMHIAWSTLFDHVDRLAFDSILKQTECENMAKRSCMQCSLGPAAGSKAEDVHSPDPRVPKRSKRDPERQGPQLGNKTFRGGVLNARGKFGYLGLSFVHNIVIRPRR
jgi:hypothetical protein